MSHYLAHIDALLIVMDSTHDPVSVSAHIENGEAIHIIYRAESLAEL
jgi:hypothetical protein